MSRLSKFPKNKAIVITGPTASGKTALAINLAQMIGAEIISADSRQVYKLMNICTAKPSSEELSMVSHHLIDFLEPSEDYSAGKFAKDAMDKMEEIISRGIIPIICGGSAFYIKALFDGLFEESEKQVEPNVREKLNNRLKKDGVDRLREELKRIDIQSYERIELDNPQRVIRALEYYYQTGEKISDAHNLRNNKKSEISPIYFAIDYPRQALYDRINERCEIMWNNGIINEYKKLINLGYSKDLNSLNTVGYKEIRLYLEGQYSEEEAMFEFKKNTRRFAKRQLTWFRKNNDITWIDNEVESKTEIILKKIEECQ
jgi:tRNA dimethylallyltransferase